eukprot:1373521-Heterocapsa_arctica.AAC.1
MMCGKASSCRAGSSVPWTSCHQQVKAWYTAICKQNRRKETTCAYMRAWASCQQVAAYESTARSDHTRQQGSKHDCRSSDTCTN